MTEKQPLLLVEDDHLDAITVMRALKDIGTPHPIVHAWDGEEALECLKCDILPCAILLDLNMPRMDGFTFLEMLCQDPKLKIIPVIILTTSQDRKDMTRCLALGAVDYVVKTFGYDSFLEGMRGIEHHWRQPVSAKG